MNEKEVLSEHRNELRDLSNVMVEETEKNHIEITNSITLQNSQAYMTPDEIYLYEIMRYSYFTDHNKDELGLEGGFDG
jgi:hypothetical protein